MTTVKFGRKMIVQTIKNNRNNHNNSKNDNDEVSFVFFYNSLQRTQKPCKHDGHGGWVHAKNSRMGGLGSNVFQQRKKHGTCLHERHHRTHQKYRRYYSERSLHVSFEVREACQHSLLRLTIRFD